MVAVHLGKAVGVPDGGECEEHGDGDEVVEDRDESRRREAANRVQHRAHQADRSVGEQLGREETEKRGGDLTLGREPRFVAADRVKVDDVRSTDRKQHGRDDEAARRKRQNGRDGVDGLLLGACRQVVDEDRDERRRENPAQHQIVDDVRRVVGEVERVGQVRVPEGVDRGEDPQQTRDSRQQRADGHVGGGGSETGPAAFARVNAPPPPGRLRRPRTRRARSLVARHGASRPREAGGGRDSRQGAWQSPPIDRPMASAAVGGRSPSPHDAGSGTEPVPGSWLRTRSCLPAAPPAAAQRRP